MDPLRARTTLLARLLGNHRTEVSAGSEGVKITGGSRGGGAPYEDIAEVRVREGWFWSSVEVVCSDGRRLEARGLSKAQTSQLAQAATRRVRDAASERVRETSPLVRNLLREFDEPGGRRAYLTRSAFQRWITRATAVPRIFRPLPTGMPRSDQMFVDLSRLVQIVHGGESSRVERNEQFVRGEATRHAELFRTRLSHPLTTRQQEAILHDEDNCIVVAGAGTGKTSTIVGKCAYVVASGLAKPEQILLMAFTRKARDEMEERVEALGLDGVAVRTFHGLGMEAIANADGRKPSLSSLAEDETGLKRWITAELREAIGAKANGPVTEFIAYKRYPYPTLRLRFMTAHSAKGLEADYAVVLDVTAGKYGFPSEIVDDPILGLVMAGQQEFANAEERRLFYVALSRAKHRTFILTDDHRRSLFVDELEGRDYYGLVVESGAASRQVACPLCEGGRLVSREGEFGRFWGCSNFPRCKAIARTCPWCEVGAFVKGVSEFRCANEKCKRSSPVCPQCQTGAVVPRTGPYGPFKGCSEWRREGASCNYKSRDRR